MSLNPYHRLLGDAVMFQTGNPWRECPYCRSSFKARWYNPKGDEMYGHWQKFCSALCWRLATEEKRQEL